MDVTSKPRGRRLPTQGLEAPMLTLALFSMVTASSTRSPMQKLPVEAAALSSVSASILPGGTLAQFLLTTLFSCRARHLCPQVTLAVLGRAGCWARGSEVWVLALALSGMPMEKLDLSGAHMPMALVIQS